jgi:phage terminase small subunit
MRKFADAYMRLFNQRQAAIEAGCPERSAHVAGSRWVRHPEVQAYISSRKLAKDMAAECTYGNMRKLADYALRELSNLDDNVSRQDRNATIETARRCLDTLARIEGLQIQKMDVSGKVEVTHNLADLARKARDYRARIERAGEEPILLEHNPAETVEKVTPIDIVADAPKATRQEQEPGQSS